MRGLRQHQHFVGAEVEHDFFGGEQRPHGLARRLGFGQAVNILLLALRSDEMRAGEFRPVFGGLEIVEIEQSADARIADEGRPAAFVEIAHLRHVLKHRDQLDAVTGGEADGVFNRRDMPERRQLVEHEADRQRRRVEIVSHFVEGGGEDEAQPAIEDGEFRRGEAEVNRHGSPVPLREIHLVAVARRRQAGDDFWIVENFGLALRRRDDRPEFFRGRFEERGRQIAQQPVGVVEWKHGVERVFDRAEQEAAHGRQILFVLGNVRRDIDIEDDRGEQLLTRRRPMIALAFAGDEQSGGERLAFGFAIVRRKARQGIETRARFAGDSEGIEVINLVVERGAAASRRLGVFALGIEDEGRAPVAQQMRDNQRDALAGARGRHNQHMLVGLEKERVFNMPERHAFRRVGLMHLDDFRHGGEARALAFVGRIVRHRLVAQPEHEADDVTGKSARLIAIDVQRVLEFKDLIEHQHRHADDDRERARDGGQHGKEQRRACRQHGEGRENERRPWRHRTPMKTGSR